MAKVLLHSVVLDSFYPSPEVDPNDPHQGKWLQGGHQLFTESARIDKYGVHTLTDSPDEADFIIFIELGSEGLFAEWVRHHPWTKKYREKVFVFMVGDHTPPFLPGLYASLSKKYYSEGRTRTGYYIRLDENPYVDYRPAPDRYKRTACFIGSLANHPVRQELKKHAWGDVLIEDTSDFATRMLTVSPEEKALGFWPHYANAMADSAFALCPRGKGPGSIRLFEALMMGRCPVILSDEWVYPKRVNWEGCSVSVAEQDVPRLRQILEEKLPLAAELGARARQEWEKFYAPDVRFHWLVEDCLDIRKARTMPEAIAGRLAWRHVSNRQNLRRFVSSKKQIFRSSRRFLL